MTTFRPGDRVHMWQNAWLASTTGTVQGTAADGRIKVRWDNGPAITPHNPQHLEPAGEPMSKRTDFLDADHSPMTIEGRADHENWAIKFATAYREFTPGNAPALALAILEAAGWPEEAKTSVTRTILHDLRFVVECAEKDAKEAADRETLEAEALELCRTMWDNPDQVWAPMSPKAQEKWLLMARKAREMHNR